MIDKADVERAAAAAAPKVAPPPPVAVAPPPAPTVTPPPPAVVPETPAPAAPRVEAPAPAKDKGSEEFQAGMRRAIALAMARSNREIPHYYLEQRMDMSKALKWLEAENLKRSIQNRVLPAVLLIKAVAKGLVQVPAAQRFLDRRSPGGGGGHSHWLRHRPAPGWPGHAGHPRRRSERHGRADGCAARPDYAHAGRPSAQLGADRRHHRRQQFWGHGCGKGLWRHLPASGGAGGLRQDPRGSVGGERHAGHPSRWSTRRWPATTAPRTGARAPGSWMC